MALPTGYASVAEADALLGTLEPWFSTAAPEKQSALDFGRLYLDTTYTCVFFDENDAPENVKDANSYLANAYLQGLLFTTPTESVSGPVTSKRVKAGSVESETKYSTRTIPSKIDPSPEATALLAQGNTCVLASRTHHLTRS